MRFTLEDFAVAVCILVLLIIAGAVIVDAYIEKRTCEADGGVYLKQALDRNVCILNGKAVDV